jgi:chaperonin GroEL (HSP60 family)
MRSTYGPYGSTIVISDQNETTTTKDGFNVFEAMGFSHHYKRMVYLAIKKICERVNRNVGDGTTSCILLADKMFRKISDIIKTPDD